MGNPYEEDKLLAEYLLFHYGADEEILGWPDGPKEALHFAERTVHELIDEASLPDGFRALDVGCAVGRSSFELAGLSGAGEVIGIDFSHRFIQAANQLAGGGTLSYDRHDEGHLSTTLSAKAPQGECSPQFQQDDAQALNADELGQFDVVHAANLLCRLPNPENFLKTLPALLKPNGQLILATPTTWLAEFTPQENWPTGGTLEYLQSSLTSWCQLEEKRDLPFLIRETARKHQWTVSLGTRWRRS